MRALRRLLLLAAVAAIALVFVRRRRPLPTGQAPAWPTLEVVVRSAPSPEAAHADRIVTAVEQLAVVVEPDGTIDAIESVIVTAVEPDGTVATIVALGDEVFTAAAEPDVLGRTWVEPVDGGCPDGFPIKANASSGIFHLPGGRSYARTKPERCYATPEDAEADGFRRAKL